MPSPGTPAPPRLPIEDSYLERIRQQLEVRIFNRQARGRRGAGAGHTAYTPYFYSSPRGIGKTSTPFGILIMGSKWKSNRTRIPTAPNSGPERNARGYPITFKGHRQISLPARFPVLLGVCNTITQGAIF